MNFFQYASGCKIRGPEEVSAPGAGGLSAAGGPGGLNSILSRRWAAALPAHTVMAMRPARQISQRCLKPGILVIPLPLTFQVFQEPDDLVILLDEGEVGFDHKTLGRGNLFQEHLLAVAGHHPGVG